MAVPQQFSLRWNNYSQHIVTALEDLRSDDEFTDVTLSCDGERLKAHKILLAACSTYFRDTFLENPCKHPVIILKGVTFTDLEAVVKFMYNGQVNVSQDRLPSFLQTAELLQIKGLTDMNDKEDNSKKRSHAGNGSSNSQNQPSNLDSNSTRSATPDVPNRPPTPKRKRIIGGYQNDGAGSSGNASFSSSSTMPNQPIVIGSSSNGASASTSSGGLLNPQSVVIPSASSTSSNVPTQPDEDGGFHNVSIVKFEDDDIQDDEFDEKHMSSEDNDNSAQDMLCNVEPGSIASQWESYYEDLEVEEVKPVDSTEEFDTSYRFKLPNLCTPSSSKARSASSTFLPDTMQIDVKPFIKVRGHGGSGVLQNSRGYHSIPKMTGLTGHGGRMWGVGTSASLPVPSVRRKRIRHRKTALPVKVVGSDGVPQYSHSNIAYRGHRITGDPSIDFTFIKTKHGTREKLIVNGNVFRFEKSVNTRSYWKCWDFPDCRARVVYRDGKVGSNGDFCHNHPPNEHVLLRELPLAKPPGSERLEQDLIDQTDEQILD